MTENDSSGLDSRVCKNSGSIFPIIFASVVNIFRTYAVEEKTFLEAGFQPKIVS
jgi:hypothetical protein